MVRKISMGQFRPKEVHQNPFLNRGCQWLHSVYCATVQPNRRANLRKNFGLHYRIANSHPVPVVNFIETPSQPHPINFMPVNSRQYHPSAATVKISCHLYMRQSSATS